jgi:hypothetical protein
MRAVMWRARQHSGKDGEGDGRRHSAYSRSIKRGKVMARGAVVDKKALERTLAEGRLGGVGLDVHWDEPGCVYSQLTYDKGALERTLAEGRLGGVGLDVHWDLGACTLNSHMTRERSREHWLRGGWVEWGWMSTGTNLGACTLNSHMTTERWREHWRLDVDWDEPGYSYEGRG